MRIFSILALALAAILLSGCMLNLPGIPTFLLAGDLETRTYEVTDFNSVSASSAFKVQIVQDDGFSVTVSADEKLFDDVRVEKVGSTLKLYLDDSRFTGYRARTVFVRISMPRIEELELSGAAQADVNFNDTGDVMVRLSGASALTGRLPSKHIKLDASGASHVLGLAGSASTALIIASGASDVDLRHYAAAKARVELSGASSAHVLVDGQLDYELSGGADLQYNGRTTLGTTRTSGGSSAGRG